MISSLELVTMVLAAIGTSALSGAIGMAGGIMLLVILTFFLPYSILIPFHGLVQLCSNSLRAFLLWRHLHRRIVGYYLLGIPAGGFLAYQLLASIQNREVFLLGIAVVIIYALIRSKQKRPLMIPMPLFSLVGAASGFLSPLIGATGPFLASFFLRDDLTRQEIVATKAMSQTLSHVIKLPIYWQLGFAYDDYAWPLALMIIGTVVGTKLGTYLLDRISERVFRRLFMGFLILALIRILYKGLAGWFPQVMS